MASLTQSDLRVITKIVQILRQDHGLHLEYQDPDLSKKVYAKVAESKDPVLTALWNTLSEEFRADAANPATSKVSENESSNRVYRGQKVEAVNDSTTEKDQASNTDQEQHSGEGHYVTYRGKKQWVPH